MNNQSLEMPDKLEPKKYVHLAEQVVKAVGQKRADGSYLFEFSPKELSPFLNQLNEIYHMLSRKKEIKESVQEQIELMKIHLIREAAQKQSIKKFVEIANLFHYIDNVGREKEQFMLLYHYVEALVTYIKFYGGYLI